MGQQGYLSTDPNAGQPVSRDGYLSTDASAGAQPPSAATSQTPPERTWLDQLKEFAGELQSLNPMSYVRASSEATYHPLKTAGNILNAQGQLAVDAENAFKSGDYVTGVRKTLHWLIPFLGPQMDKASDHFVAGEYAKGLGATADVGVQLFGPAAVSKIKTVPIPGLGGSRLNPAGARAVQFGESRGVPMDAATATGRPIVSIGQKRVSDTMGGAGIAERVKANQATALERVGNDLANTAHPAAIDPVGAGRVVTDAVKGRITQLHQKATTAYDALRAMEHKQAQIIQQHGGIQAPASSPKPFTNVPLAVDVAPAKTSLRPLYDQLAREKEIVGVLQGGKARALVALDTLMRGPDMAPLSVVDGALSDLKAMARGAEMPELRTGGQAAAAEAVTHLDRQVRATAAKAGPNVLKALEDGRKATVAKYQAGEVLETLSSEPRKVFDMLTTRKDGALERLKAVQREAPAELPKIGRAYLEDLLQRATAEGHFSHADALFSEWQKLGPETKRLVFPDAQLRGNLDSFFLLAKRIAANPNPSGTARVMTFFNVGSTIPAYALANLFYSPKGIALLKRGLTIPVGSKAAKAAYLADLARVVGEGGIRGPAAAEADQARQAP